MEKIHILMVFKDGTCTPVSTNEDPGVKMCLSDPFIQNFVRNFLKSQNQTEAKLVMWGRGDIKSVNIVDHRNVPQTIPAPELDQCKAALQPEAQDAGL